MRGEGWLWDGAEQQNVSCQPRSAKKCAAIRWERTPASMLAYGCRIKLPSAIVGANERRIGAGVPRGEVEAGALANNCASDTEASLRRVAAAISSQIACKAARARVGT